MAWTHLDAHLQSDASDGLWARIPIRPPTARYNLSRGRSIARSHSTATAASAHRKSRAGKKFRKKRLTRPFAGTTICQSQWAWAVRQLEGPSAGDGT